MRRSMFLAALSVIAALAAACSGGGTTATPRASSPAASAPGASAPTAGGATVSIKDFTFTPPAVTVKAGAEVVWTNNDDAPHTVKWTDGTAESPRMAKAGTYPRTFATAGTFAYRCGIHDQMSGSVVVE